uniref:Ubiquitin-like protease family profile domain-containing protein n=1 Tax=Ditylenchus dipsaci TaxID=166011 RepID=A0A915D5G9_9BILA
MIASRLCSDIFRASSFPSHIVFMMLFMDVNQMKWLLAISCADKTAGGKIFIFGRKSYSHLMIMVEKIFVDGTFMMHRHCSNRSSTTTIMLSSLMNDKSVPKQTNGCDCGNFICQFAERASREVCPSCKQEDMDEYRKQMASELQAEKLLKEIGRCQYRDQLLSKLFQNSVYGSHCSYKFDPNLTPLLKASKKPIKEITAHRRSDSRLLVIVAWSGINGRDNDAELNAAADQLFNLPTACTLPPSKLAEARAKLAGPVSSEPLSSLEKVEHLEDDALFAIDRLEGGTTLTEQQHNSGNLTIALNTAKLEVENFHRSTARLALVVFLLLENETAAFILLTQSVKLSVKPKDSDTTNAKADTPRLSSLNLQVFNRKSRGGYERFLSSTRHQIFECKTGQKRRKVSVNGVSNVFSKLPEMALAMDSVVDISNTGASDAANLKIVLKKPEEGDKQSTDASTQNPSTFHHPHLLTSRLQ